VPPSLTSWQPGDQLPNEALAALPAAIERLEAETRPAPEDVVGNAVFELLQWCQDFKLLTLPEKGSPDRPKAVERFVTSYRKALSTLPPDLLRYALDQLYENYRPKFPRPPTPAEAVAFGRDALRERQETLRKAQAAHGHAKRNPEQYEPPMDARKRSPEEVAAVEAITSKMFAEIGKSKGFAAQDHTAAVKAAMTEGTVPPPAYPEPVGPRTDGALPGSSRVVGSFARDKIRDLEARYKDAAE
jgi:hypothetical protein